MPVAPSNTHRTLLIVGLLLLGLAGLGVALVALKAGSAARALSLRRSPRSRRRLPPRAIRDPARPADRRAAQRDPEGARRAARLELEVGADVFVDAPAALVSAAATARPRPPPRALSTRAAPCPAATALRRLERLTGRSRFARSERVTIAVVMAAGLGTRLAAADRALAEADPPGRRPAGDRDAPARARGGRLRLLRRRHRPSGRADRGAARRRFPTRSGSSPSPSCSAPPTQSARARRSRRSLSPPPTRSTAAAIPGASRAPSRRAARPGRSRCAASRASAPRHAHPRRGRARRPGRRRRSDESGSPPRRSWPFGPAVAADRRATCRGRRSSWPTRFSNDRRRRPCRGDRNREDAGLDGPA